MIKRYIAEFVFAALLIVLLTLLPVLFSSCRPDTAYIDHYQVGDEVELSKLAKGCYGVIIEYIPMSHYRIKIKCPFIIPNSLSEAIFSEFVITGKRIKK